jgi:DNA-binding HxlR family transcriptional regulator
MLSEPRHTPRAASGAIGTLPQRPRAEKEQARVVVTTPRPTYTRRVKSIADYAQKYDRLQDNCPVRAALDVIRGRWKPSLLYELKDGPKRFSELHAALAGITPQTLTVQLRQLAADGVVSRTVYPEIPARVDYALTEFGATLSRVMDELEAWGAEYLARRTRPQSRPLTFS